MTIVSACGAGFNFYQLLYLKEHSQKKRNYLRRFIALSTVIILACWQQATFAQPQTLRVGVYENPPKIMLKDSQPSGIFGELLIQIAEQEDWQLQAVPCSWNRCLELLSSGAIDLMPDVALSDIRDELYIFHSTPVLHSWSQLYGRQNLKVDSLLDLEGVRIAVLEDSIQQTYLIELIENFGLNVSFKAVSSFDAGFRAVLTGQADAVAVNHLYGDLRARQLGLEATPVMFQPTRLYIVAGQADMQFAIDTIERYIAEWRADADSPFYQTLKRWHALMQTEQTFPRTLVIFLLIAILSTLLIALWFRRRVKQQSLELFDSEQKLNTILDSVEAYIFIKDMNLRYLYANRKVCDYLGTTPEAILGHTDSEFFDAATCAHLAENDRRVLDQGERVSDEEQNVTNDGQLRHFLSVKIPLKDAQDRVYALCGISTDITEHLSIKEALNQLEYYDTITGLANRKLLLQNLEHALASSARTGYEGALVAVDLTRFTVLNDTLGHAFGDEVLKQAAARIRQQIESTDTAARLGSDDFIVILEDLDLDAMEAIHKVRNWARQLVELLSEPYELGDLTHTSSACIGITMFTDTETNVEGLLKNADLAIAEAKHQGEGAVRFFNPSMQENINRRVKIEVALRRAIANQELELYLQPQVDDNQQVIAGELLLRWTDSQLGSIPPNEFIPIAESSGLIIPLGSWVIEQACRTLRDWQEIPALKHLSLAVNISPKQFRHGGFVTQVEHCVTEAKLPAGLLDLEITESMLIENVELTVKRMHKLGELGVRFSLDDFGTGYASLAYLKQLPLYQLKIDQSFVRDMLIDNNDEVITTTILGLGANLNLSVIAEGVETEQQMQRLRELGCRKFQGYLFGRPAPIAQWQAHFLKSLKLETE